MLKRGRETPIDDDSNTQSRRDLKKQDTAQSVEEKKDESQDENFPLKIIQSPENSTVYKRILKPFPTVLLNSDALRKKGHSHRFYVRVSLLQEDGTELENALDGARVQMIKNGMIVAFKRLKISVTSQQASTRQTMSNNFRLKFQLLRFEKNAYVPIDGIFVISDPITVFSHTHYLKSDS